MTHLSARNSPSLLGLPPELRNNIYDFVFDANRKFEDFRQVKECAPPPALTRVSRQLRGETLKLHHEATTIFWRQAELCFTLYYTGEYAGIERKAAKLQHAQHMRFLELLRRQPGVVIYDLTLKIHTHVIRNRLRGSAVTELIWLRAKVWEGSEVVSISCTVHASRDPTVQALRYQYEMLLKTTLFSDWPTRAGGLDVERSLEWAGQNLNRKLALQNRLDMPQLMPLQDRIKFFIAFFGVLVLFLAVVAIVTVAIILVSIGVLHCGCGRLE